MVSSFNDHQGQKQRRAPEAAVWYHLTGIWPPRNCTPKKERRESSIERSLANVRNTHQKALATAAALEEEIEWLSYPPTRTKPRVRIHSRSRDCGIHESRGWKSRHHQMQPESFPAPYFEYNPSRRNSESGREVMATEDSDLEGPLELEPEITSFLRGLAENSEEEEEAPPPESPLKELHRWVTWKAKMCKTPDWWRELLAVPGVPNCKKLVQKVQASFSHAKRVSEVNRMKNYYQAPLHNCVSSERISSHLPTLSSPAETFGRCKERGQWCMPIPSCIGQRRLICLLEGNHACWLRV